MRTFFGHQCTIIIKSNFVTLRLLLKLESCLSSNLNGNVRSNVLRPSNSNTLNKIEQQKSVQSIAKQFTNKLFDSLILN